MHEIWKDVVGYEGLYKVSNMGQICSLKDDKILKPTKHSIFDYMLIRLKKDNTAKLYYVHRLVAKAFIDNPSNLDIVNHIDLDKTNNNVSNLEWCTQKENVHHYLANRKKRKPNK